LIYISIEFNKYYAFFYYIFNNLWRLIITYSLSIIILNILILSLRIILWLVLMRNINLTTNWSSNRRFESLILLVRVWSKKLIITFIGRLLNLGKVLVLLNLMILLNWNFTSVHEAVIFILIVILKKKKLLFLNLLIKIKN
jgi:hypothetical protein